MVKKKYYIDGSLPMDPVLKGCWRVISEDGYVVTKCYGPYSLMIAQAACEKLNSDFEEQGRFDRFEDIRWKGNPPIDMH